MALKKRVVEVVLAIAALAAIGCGSAGGSTKPITVQKTDAGKISFVGTIQPILKDHCWRCHDKSGKDTKYYQRSQLHLMDYEGVMKGGKDGPVVNPGKPDESRIITSVEKKKTPFMPPRIFPALTEDRIAALRSWISEGAENN